MCVAVILLVQRFAKLFGCLLCELNEWDGFVISGFVQRLEAKRLQQSGAK